MTPFHYLKRVNQHPFVMKASIFSSFLFLFSFVLPAQDLVVEGKAGIGTDQIGKQLEVIGIMAVKDQDSGGTAFGVSSEGSGLVSMWTNNNYNPQNHTSGWMRTMNLKDGNVGIGTINAFATLHTYNASSTAILGESDTNWGIFGKTNSGTGVRGVTNVGGIGVMGVSDSGSTGIGVKGSSDDGHGVVGRTGGSSSFDFYAENPVAARNYGSASSKRWKRNIKVISHALDKLLAIRGIYFNWDEDHGGEHSLGFIAEEVGEVLPEIVVYEKNGLDAVGMDYSKMTPLLVEAAKAMRQEYQKKFEEQEYQLNSQQSEIEALKQELEEIKALLKVQVSNEVEE